MPTLRMSPGCVPGFFPLSAGKLKGFRKDSGNQPLKGTYLAWKGCNCNVRTLSSTSHTIICVCVSNAQYVIKKMEKSNKFVRNVFILTTKFLILIFLLKCHQSAMHDGGRYAFLRDLPLVPWAFFPTVVNNGYGCRISAVIWDSTSLEGNILKPFL